MFFFRYLKSIKYFKDNSSIVIYSSDKGKDVVITVKATYTQKLLQILIIFLSSQLSGNVLPYILHIEDKINHFFNTLKNKV